MIPPASSQLVAPAPALAIPIPMRRRLRRLHGRLRQLDRELCPHFPEARALAISPAFASAFDCTPQDHVVADLLVALRTTAAAIAEIDLPIPLDQPPASAPGHHRAF